MKTSRYVAILIVICLITSAQAATNVWNQLVSGNASGSWNTAANPPWSLGAVPGAGDTANFATLNITTTAGVSNSIINLNADQSIDRMIFADTTTSSAANYVFSSGTGSNVLTLSGSSPEITARCMPCAS